ncbi:MAG TPA: hypothetical protein VFW53_08040 [Gallionella sp.]|nr:hypothetical protein [Gallionella sp.]
MKRYLITALLAIAATSAAAADVGVSVSIGQPGFYGRIDVGNYPQPQVIYSQPVVIQRAPLSRPPIYLRVPPGHAKHWGKHCHKYNACNERVYFVRDNWYNQEYVPRYQEQHRERRDDRRDERQNDSGNDRHGNQNGKGHGNGHGRDH